MGIVLRITTGLIFGESIEVIMPIRTLFTNVTNTVLKYFCKIRTGFLMIITFIS